MLKIAVNCIICKHTFHQKISKARRLV